MLEKIAKAICLFSIIFCATEQFLFSQSIQVKAGVNIATRQYKENGYINRTVYDPIAGINLGINYEQKLTDIFSVSGGLMLNSRGFRSHSNITYINGYTHDTIYEVINHKSHLQYLDIPLSVRFKAEMGRHFFFYGYGGPYIGFLTSGQYLSATIHADSTGLYITPVEGKINMKNYYNPRIDFGFNVGGGVDVYNFFFDFAFTAGIRNAGYKSKTLKTPNRALILSFGYRIEL